MPWGCPLLRVELYAANFDWPSNNWITARERGGDEEFRMFVYDVENAFLPEHIEANGINQFPFEFGGGLNGDEGPLSHLYNGLGSGSTVAELNFRPQAPHGQGPS